MSRTKLPVSIIIVTYNCNKFVFNCINKLINSHYSPSEIIIIDNRSAKSPLKEIKQKYSKFFNIKVIQNKKNEGFAKAINKAGRMSKEKFLLLINPDFYVEKNSIKNLWELIKKKNNVAVIGGKSINFINKKTSKTIANRPNFITLLIEFTSLNKIFNKLGLKNISNFWNLSVLKAYTPKDVFSVSGCFMLINKKWFMRVRGFDEKFFLYLEDLDFCLRIINAGGKILYNPKALGYHFEGGSSNQKPNKINQKAWDKSKRYFSKKHFGVWGKMLSKIYYIDDKLVNFKKKIQ